MTLQCIRSFLRPQTAQDKVTKVFTSCYGAYNEIRDVADAILNNTMPFGEVCVYYTSEAYENILRSIFGGKGIPFTFTSAVRASSGRLVQFMLDVLQFVEEDASYRILGKVVRNTLLDLDGVMGCYNRTLRERIGYSKERYLEYCRRMSNDENRNEKWLQFLTDIVGIFEEHQTIADNYESLLAFVKRYIYRQSLEWQMLSGTLKEQQDIYRSAVFMDKGQPLREQIDQIRDFLLNVAYREEEQPDAVRIVRISGADHMDRRYNFMVGLSYGDMTAHEIDSPVLTDEDIRSSIDFGTDGAEPENVFAKNRNREYEENLRRTIATLTEGELYFSRSHYDMVNFKEMAPSLFYLSEKNDREERPITGYECLEQGLFVADDALADLAAKKEPEADAKTDTQTENEAEEDKNALPKMSVTKVQTLLDCPLKYHYRYEQNLPERSHTDWDITKWLDPSAKGTLYHRIMQLYGKQVLLADGNKTVGKDLAETVFHDVVKQAVREAESANPYSNQRVFEEECADVREVTKRDLEKLHKDAADDGWNVLGCEIGFGGFSQTDPGQAEPEEDFEIRYQDRRQNGETTEFIWNGSVDRLDGKVDEKGILQLRIVDYKTGKASGLKNKIEGYVVGNDTFFKDHQIQHYVYADAILEYVRKNRAAIAGRLGKNESELMGVSLAEVSYYFPYEKSPQTDVTPLVRDAYELADPSDVWSGRIRYPKEMKELLTLMLDKPLMERNREGEFERLVEKRQEDEKKLQELLKDKSLKKNCRGGYKEQCDQSRCRYMDICRMR